MTTICINPGAAAVDGTSEANARACIDVFVGDLGISGVEVVRGPEQAAQDEGGRYCFDLVKGERRSTIDMPGLPVERVRWMGEPGQNIWHFPRLYENGSSWVWKFALSQALGSLVDEDAQSACDGAAKEKA